ncbi:MAG: hypothetical protein IKJ35_04980 [Clostridia bacterium]|nr:hypothetical protein [Clostridia bacterium]
MNNKKIVFIALLIFIAIVVVAVAVYLIDPPEDNIPDNLESYESPRKEEEQSETSGELQVEQDKSDGKYGEMKGPNSLN